MQTTLPFKLVSQCKVHIEPFPVESPASVQVALASPSAALRILDAATVSAGQAVPQSTTIAEKG